MKIQLTAVMSTEAVKVLQKIGRLSADMSARQALHEELQAVVDSHIDDLDHDFERALEDKA